MPKVIYERDGRIGRITLNRPEVMNAIDDDLPVELASCVERANADASIPVIVLSGAGEAFCAGYDLTYYAQLSGGKSATQEMPWDKQQQMKWDAPPVANYLEVSDPFEHQRDALCRLAQDAETPATRKLATGEPHGETVFIRNSNSLFR
jgi:hypothetical protein